ncbi:MAG: FkbM family methyltransferase, partial [Cyanobacteria bacterium]|nr:FkbM family methyltransferase [Cyanobacteria bacterium GSL.Bin21]
MNDTPLEKLEGEYTFGVNRIYLLFDRISWRPSFYTINDWEVGPDNAEEIKALAGMTFFFPKRFQGLFEQTDSTYWYNSRHPRFKGDDFSYDLTKGAVMGGSVLPLAIQIAYYMGFDPIYLIGVDVDYKISDTVEQSGTKRFADGNLQFLKSTQDNDPNHFDPRYFGKGRRWHNPNVERMIEGFRVCREAIERKGGHIYNATVGGKLEVMERVNFNSIFEQEFNPPPKVSIVMPAYNAESFIGEAINSVLAQTYQSWELIIVNDGSQDNTKQIIESFQDPRIICIDQENAGRSNARNTALKHVRGDYVTFLDADDFYTPNNLELQVKFLQENQYAGAVVGSIKRVAEDGRPIKVNIRPSGQIIPTKSFLIGNPAHLQSTMFRRQWVNPSVLFNPEARAGEDWEFNIQRALAGCIFVRQSVVVCSYRCTEVAKRKTTEPYAEAMAAVIDRIFDSMALQSVYKEMEDLARYHVNLRMATRFFSTEQYELGQKYFLKALKYTDDKFNDNFYESVSNNLVGWLIQLDTKKPSNVLKTAISYLPDTLDKKQIETRSRSKLRKNFILRSGIGSSFFYNRQLRKKSENELTGGLRIYDRKEHAHINETRLIFELTSSFPSGSVMIDVGAHFGGSLERFARNGWEVYAFEPDPVNRERLLSRIEDCRTVRVDSRAVSNCTQEGLPFFSSDVSFGISTLNPFHESHQETCKVSTTTVADICKDNGLTSIDFLKIDTEGYDLMVLQGVPWEKVKPWIIECEFEDAKTIPLGYQFEHIAQYLVDKGYTVLVSEWHPVVEYGRRHDWHRLVAYPCQLNNPNAWGNLIAFREPPNFEKVAAIANRLVKTNPEKKYSKTGSPASDKNKRIPQMISKVRLKLTNPLNVYAVQQAFSLLKRIGHYYSRWPVILAMIAIALNTVSMLEVPFRWAFLMSGTGVLVLLIGHAASKADYAL